MDKLPQDVQGLLERARGAEPSSRADRSRVRRKLGIALAEAAATLATTQAAASQLGQGAAATKAAGMGLPSGVSAGADLASKVAAGGPGALGGKAAVSLGGKAAAGLSGKAAVGLGGLGSGKTALGALALGAGKLGGGAAWVIGIGLGGAVVATNPSVREWARSSFDLEAPKSASVAPTRSAENASGALTLKRVASAAASNSTHRDEGLRDEDLRDEGLRGVTTPEPVPPALPSHHSGAKPKLGGAPPPPMPAKAQPSKAATPGSPGQPEEGAAHADIKRLSQAQQALSGGDAAGAWSLLRDHELRFPRSVVAVERAGLKVLVLCRLGRTEEARAAAAVFQNIGSQSPLAPRVRSSCAGPDNATPD